MKDLKTISLVALATLLVAGCTLTPERASSMVSYDLCAVMMSPSQSNQNKNTAMNEIDKRGFDCSRVSNQIVMQQQLEQQRLISQQQMQLQQQQISNDLAAKRMQSLQQGIRQQTNCNSYIYGNNINTNCY